MPLPSLYPMFLANPFAGGTGGGGGETVVTLMAEPDITIDPDIYISLEDETVNVEVDDDIEVTVEVP